MTADLDLYGVFVPALFAWLLLAYGLHLILSRVLARAGFYRLVWASTAVRRFSLMSCSRPLSCFLGGHILDE